MTKFVVLPDGVNDKGKPTLNIHALDENEVLAAEGFYVFERRKDLARFRVGNVYDIPTRAKDEKTTSFTMGEAKWEGQYKERIKFLEWQAKQEAAEAHAKAKAREQKEATGDSGLLAALAPLQEAYRKLPYPHRLGFEVWVLSVLRRG
jgi:hypothetical protein